MNNLYENDIIKVFYQLLGDKKEKCNFKDEMFEEILKVASKEIPAEELLSSGYELEVDDGGFFGVSKENEFTIWFDGDFYDEEEVKYNDDAILFKIEIVKNNTTILEPDIAIGKEVSFDDLFNAIDGCANGKAGTIDLGSNMDIITFSLEDFQLEFMRIGSNLENVSIYNFRNHNCLEEE